jgi:uncharacterized phiE125 gp8 family phage protein
VTGIFTWFHQVWPDSSVKYGIRQTVAPESTVVTVDDAKHHCRIDTSFDDDYVNGLILAAESALQKEYGCQFLTATWQLVLDYFPPTIRVPISPLQSVTSITYDDVQGNQQTLDTSWYLVDDVRQPARIQPSYGHAWPPTYTVLNPITITFTAGYGDEAASVPAGCVHAIKLYVNALYQNREPTEMEWSTIGNLMIDVNRGIYA